MLADELDYVVGVDTHRDQHVLAVVVVPTGAVIAQRSVAATARGYAAALRFAEEFAPGARLWAIEGAGHYGAGLARHLPLATRPSTRAPARPAPNGGCAARTTRSTRPARRARLSEPAFVRLPVRESVRKRCGY